MKKYTIISDLHGTLPEINQTDVLLICGDISPIKYDRDIDKCLTWFRNDFVRYIEKIDCEKVVLTPGNHDFLFWHIYLNNSTNSTYIQEYIFGDKLKDKLVILIDDFVKIDGKKIYGTPWCPELVNWAFYGDTNVLFEKFNKIPKDIDILLTHCPPKAGTAGVVLQQSRNYRRDFGCTELSNVINYKLNHLKFVFCGHIHSGEHGCTFLNNTRVINVSILDELYNYAYDPQVYYI